MFGGAYFRNFMVIAGFIVVECLICRNVFNIK